MDTVAVGTSTCTKRVYEFYILLLYGPAQTKLKKNARKKISDFFFRLKPNG